MGLIREPKNVDLVIQSKPWTEDEVNELREIMRKRKAEKQANEKRRSRVKQRKVKSTK